MVEVLVAVVILAFTATAAIKLVVLAQNTLRETRTKQALYDAALEIQTGIRIGDKDLSGSCQKNKPSTVAARSISLVFEGQVLFSKIQNAASIFVFIEFTRYFGSGFL